MTPRIIHMIYIPWDRNQRLLENTEEFDRTAYDAMRKYAPDFEVRLWTHKTVSLFAQQHFPGVWDVLQKVARPVMMIDVLRWMVVHHFGGIYWQMNTTPLVPMTDYLPSSGHNVRLFTEFDLNPEQCRIAMPEPIRHGEPEETKRVLIQVFSALPGAAFVKNVIDLQVERLKEYQPKKDYDVLFITGNALVSTAYDRYGKNDVSVELINRTDSRRMIKWHYRGTWRTDQNPRSEARGQGAEVRGQKSEKLIPRGAGRIPLIASAYYRFLARHPHEELVEQLTAAESRYDYRSLLAPWLNQQGAKSVFEIPKAGWNAFYSRIPPVDLLLCADYLERVSYAEALRILRRLLSGGARFLALTHYPLLTESWDTALGDERPINYCLPPFNFPEPDAQIPCANPDGRPDRVLAVWNISCLVIKESA